MKRRWSLVGVIAGVLIGYLLPVAFTSPGQRPSTTSGTTTATSAPSTVTRMTAVTSPETTFTATTSLPSAGVYLVWATGGLPESLVEGLQQAFDQVSIVKGDVVELSVGRGFIPLDGLALTPESHSFFDRHGELLDLEPGSVVLGETSARLRDSAVGATLRLDGIDFVVAAVVSDEIIGAAEVVFHVDDPQLPLRTDRFALVRSDMDRQDFEDLVRGLYSGPAPLRIRSEGETPWLRHGDAVLPQVFIKEALGEFSYTQVGGTTFDQDQGFVDQNVMRARIPLLGEVRCHEVVIDMLQGAMAQLVDDGLAHLVEAGGFAGCWFPRFISPVVGVSSGVSRHAWGAAVDLNAASNPVGSSGNQDRRLVEAMRRWGFTWGGDWLVPDPMHFEFAAQD